MVAVHLNCLSVLALISLSAPYLSSLDRSLITLIFCRFMFESETFKIWWLIPSKFCQRSSWLLHFRSSPATQSPQYSVNKEIAYLNPPGIYVSGYALEWQYGLKRICTHVWAYHIYTHDEHKSQTNSRQKITLNREFCALIFFPTRPYNFQCTKAVGMFSLWHIWQSPAFSNSYA